MLHFFTQKRYNKLFISALACCLFFSADLVQAQVTLPYIESFEQAGPDTFIIRTTPAVNGLSGPGYSWSYFKPDGLSGRLRFRAYADVAKTGKYAATLDDFFPDSIFSKNELVLNIDLSNYSSRDVNLSFSYMSHNEDSLHSDSVWIRGSIFDPWIPIYDLYGNRGVSNFGLDGVYKDVRNLPLSSLLQAAGQSVSSLTQVKFGQQDNSSAVDPLGADGLSFDNVIISAVEPVDVGISSVFSTSSSCLLLVEPASVLVQNYGSDTIQTVPLMLSVNDTLLILDTLRNLNLAPGAFTSHTIQQLIDMSPEGVYNLRAWTSLLSDNNNFNDTSDIYTTTHFRTISSYPFTESFNDSVTNWYSFGRKDSWTRFSEFPCSLPDNLGGFYTYKFRPEIPLSGNYCNSFGHGIGELSWLHVGDCFDFGTNLAPVVEMDLTVRLPSGDAGLILQSSIDAGTSWQTVGGYNTGVNWYNDSSLLSRPAGQGNGWTGDVGHFTAEHYLFHLAGEGNVQFRFVFDAEGPGVSSGIYVRVNNFTLYELPLTDARVAELVSPADGCDLGSSEPFTIHLINRGKDTLRSCPVAYQINAGPVVRDTIRGIALPLDDTLAFTFNNPANFTQYQQYNFKIWAELGGYTLVSRDTLFKTIFNVPLITSYPYFDDFEDTTSLWYTQGLPSSWTLASPNMVHVQGSPRGQQAWVTAKDVYPGTGGTYTSEESYLLAGACFDFSTLQSPVVQFDLNYHLERSSSPFEQGAFSLEYSTDFGANWATVGGFRTGINWYNNLNSWRGEHNLIPYYGGLPRWLTAKHVLDFLAGEPAVRFRFKLEGSREAHEEGASVDNFAVYQALDKDASVETILSPRPTCDLTNPQAIQVLIKANGEDTLYSIPLAVRLPDGTIARDTFNGVLVPEAVDTFTFSTLAAASNQAGYDIIVWAEKLGDIHAFNDTIRKAMVAPLPIAQFPYAEDFEQGDGGWFAYGENYTWRNTIPDTSMDGLTLSGLFAWLSHSSEPHEGIEGGYVESPCFDFSTITQPLISLNLHIGAAHFRPFSNPAFSRIDGAKLQYSTDNGTTWVDVGKKDSSWYNSNYISSFRDGTSTGWASYRPFLPLYPHLLDWVTVQTHAPQLGGEPQVKFRMYFFNGQNSTSGAIGFDKFEIQEAPLDLTLVGKVSPAGGCLNGSVPVCTQIKNTSGFDMINPVLKYQVNNGRVTSETLNDTINPRSIIDFCFSRTTKIFSGRPTNLTIWIEHPLDTVHANDTLRVYIPGSNVVINTFPHLQTFDGDLWVRDSVFQISQNPIPRTDRPLPEGWINNAQDNTVEWLVWSRRNDRSFLPDNSSGGGNFLQVWYGDTTLPREVVLFSPCFDISQLSHPEMRVKTYHYGGQRFGAINFPVAYVDLIHNGTLIPDFAQIIDNRVVTFNDDPWEQARVSLDGFQGEVSFRFRTNSQLMPILSLDNFEILDVYPDDIAVTNILEPYSGTCSSPSDSVWVELCNIGTTAQTGFLVSANNNQGSSVSAIFQDTLAPETCVPFYVGTMPTTPGGIQQLEAYTVLARDSVHANDTARLLIEIGPTPTASLITNDTVLLCEPATTTLRVFNPDSLADYYWYDSSGSFLTSGDTLDANITQAQTQFFVEEKHYTPKLLITEVNTGFPWGIEVKNMSQGELDTRGWTLYVRNFDLSTPYAFSWELLHFDPLEVQYRNATKGPNTLGGGGLFFNPLPLSGRGWVAIVDDNCNIIDFVPFGLNAAAIAQSVLDLSRAGAGIQACGRSLPFGPHWSGDGVQSTSGYVIRRTDTIDTDVAANWDDFQTPDMGVSPLVTLSPACSGPLYPITVLLSPAVAPQLPDLQVCGGSTLDAGAGYQSYQWSTGDTTQVLNLPDTTLSVSVLVTDSNGCTASDTANISILPGPDPGLLTSIAFCDSGSIAVDSALFTNTIRWSTNDTGSSILVPTSGIYSVAVTDPRTGCTGYDTTIIKVNASPLVDIGPMDTILCAGAMLDGGSFAHSPMYNWRGGANTPQTTVSNAGLYHLMVADSNQCTGQDSINVRLFVSPGAGFTFTGNNSPYQFTSTSTGAGLQYLWDFGDGDSSLLRDPTHTHFLPGLYVVCLTVSDTCGMTDTFCDTLQMLVGIPELAKDDVFNIFPNPTNRFFTIETEGNTRWDQLTLSDAHGRTILQQPVFHQGNTSQVTVDMQHLAEGMYFVTIKNAERSMTKKVVKR